MALLTGYKEKDAAALLAASEGHLWDDEPRLALETAEQALALSREVKDATGAADALRAFVLAQAAGAEVDAGLERARDGIETYKKASFEHGQGVMLLALAEAQVMNQEPEEALARADEAKLVFQKTGEKAWQAKTLLATASAHQLLARTTDAVEATEEALKLFREAADKQGEAAALQQLAIAQLETNKTLEVLKILEGAASIYKELGCAKEQGSVLTSMAELQLNHGTAKDALHTAQKAWQAAKESGCTVGLAGAMGIVARAYVAANLLEEAVQVMEDEAAKYKTAGHAKGEAAALTAIFQARLAVEDSDAALDAARKALGALSAARDPKGSAQILHSIAALEYERGYFELALRAAREALAVLADAGGRPGDEAALETLVACAHEARGEAPPSSTLRAKALSVLGELSKALEEQNAEAFEGALKRLGRQSAFTSKDTERALAAAKKQAPEATEDFLAKHLTDWPGAVVSAPEPPMLKVPPAFSLRSFAVQANYLSGRTDDQVEWSQTMGRFVLSYLLPQAAAGAWKQQDVVVEMSKNSVKVMLDATVVKALSGELTEEVWRKHSWWVLHEETGTLEIHLYKRQLSTWKSPWWSPQNVVGWSGVRFRRSPFPWTKDMEKHGSSRGLFTAWGITFEDPKEEAEMGAKPPGRPPAEEEDGEPGYQRSSFAEVFNHRSSRFVCSADEVVLGITTEEGERAVNILIHFERWKWEDLKQRVPLEKLLAADIWERELCIFLRGDKSNPIVWGELAGSCSPEETTWRLVSAEALRSRQQMLGSYTPALLVTLVKARPVKWNKVFTTCVQHRLMVEDPGDQSEDPKRFEGLKDAPHLRRTGFDLDSADFWSYVDSYVEDTMRRIGHSTLPKKLVLA